MTANDCTPGEGESASGDSGIKQQRLAREFAVAWDRLRLAFLEAGVDVEEGEADAELVEELREEISDATEVVDDLEEFIDEER